jgi:hypothetical protein
MRSWIVALALALVWPVASANETLRAHRVHRIDNWQEMLARPLVERVAVAPPMVVEYVNLENEAHGFPQRARAAQASPAFIAEVKAAVAELPTEVQLLFVDRLGGILLVEELGGTGFTDVIDVDGGHDVAGYIVLDAGVLAGRTANEWATWKESSPFTSDPAWQLEANIERGGQDNRRQAIQYILLHELGHVLSIGRTLHPPWTIRPKDAAPTTRAYSFFELSWEVDTRQNKYVSLFDRAFTLRPQVAYYFGAKLKAAQMADVYAQLARTNFPSLYAAAQPGDDFAEAFASYVHVVLMKRPWEIVIRKGGEEVTRFGACWEEERCVAKRRIIEDLIKGP